MTRTSNDANAFYPFRLGSLFDGSGGFPLAGLRHGFVPVWASEVEPFPILVTRRRLPGMHHLGSVTGVDGGGVEPVDVVTFGSPCQDLSVAGKRAGIGGERSNLFFEAVRVIKDMRKATNNEYPRFAVWENVPGAFSSNHGADFHAVLQALISISNKEAADSLPHVDRWERSGAIVGSGWSIAWRVLDAQYFGVAQRRRRIFLICDFNSPRAPQILFEPHSLPRDPHARSTQEQDTTPVTTRGSDRSSAGEASRAYAVRMRSGKPGGGKGPLVQTDLSGTLATGNDQTIFQAQCEGAVLFGHHPQDARFTGPRERAETITARYGTGGGNAPLVLRAFGFNAIHDRGTHYTGKYGYPTEVSKTLDCKGGEPSCNQGGIAIIHNQCQVNEHGVDVVSASKSDFFTRGNLNHAGALLASDANEPPIVTDPQTPAHNAENRNGDDGGAGGFVVRRLTPTECARLQGFPDWWTEDLANTDPTEAEVTWWRSVFDTWGEIAGLKKRKTEAQVRRWLANPVTDRAEYKMWGNGIALPCAEFVLGRIADELQQDTSQ